MTTFHTMTPAQSAKQVKAEALVTHLLRSYGITYREILDYGGQIWHGDLRMLPSLRCLEVKHLRVTLPESPNAYAAVFLEVAKVYDKPLPFDGVYTAAHALGITEDQVVQAYSHALAFHADTPVSCALMSIGEMGQADWFVYGHDKAEGSILFFYSRAEIQAYARTALLHGQTRVWSEDGEERVLQVKIPYPRHRLIREHGVWRYVGVGTGEEFELELVRTAMLDLDERD